MDSDRTLADMLAELAASLDTANGVAAGNERAGLDQRTSMEGVGIAAVTLMPSAG